MRKGIALIVFSILLFVVALFVGIQSRPNPTLKGGEAGSEIGASETVPSVVLPPEQLSQFKHISVYTPPKKASNLYIDPPNSDLKPSKEESDKSQPGVM